uniref:Uncharacterized protein n=1 Tax=Oryza sativa subsp. japonica TaxID=39947 RepID=Q7EYU7_ORYSJ|nr:hypothetical protein [Oryza sativa Japonica Group]
MGRVRPLPPPSCAAVASARREPATSPLAPLAPDLAEGSSPPPLPLDLVEGRPAAAATSASQPPAKGGVPAAATFAR